MIYSFGGFHLDTARMELTAQGEIVELEPKTFDLLLFLLEHRDRVVSKDEIHENVWPGVFVTDASVSTCLKQLRRALGDDGKTQTAIRTLRGKGYRFVAEVEASGPLRPPASPVPVDAGTASPVRPAGPPVIAVLPFVLIRTDDRHSAIAEAIPTEMISALSRLRSVKVIARGSSFRFDPASPDYGDIRQRLGAGYVVSGSVELNGRTLSVTAELTDTANAHVVWAGSYSGTLDDLFSVRQSVVHEVCNAVEIQIPLSEAERLTRVPTENLDAWGHYHMGIRHLLWYPGTHNDLSRHHMRQAIGLDPGFARAYSALAYSELEDHDVLLSQDGPISRAKGMDLAEQAVGLDPFDPFCNLVLGRAQWISGDIDAALSWADRSVHLNHNYALGHYELGKFHAIACSGAEADRYASTALSLSPLDPNVSGMLSARALAAFVRDDREKALQFATESMHAPNRHPYVCALAAAIYCANGDMKRAEVAMAGVRDWNTRVSLARVLHLFSLKDAGKQREMVVAFEQMGLA